MKLMFLMVFILLVDNSHSQGQEQMTEEFTNCIQPYQQSLAGCSEITTLMQSTSQVNEKEDSMPDFAPICNSPCFGTLKQVFTGMQSCFQYLADDSAEMTGIEMSNVFDPSILDFMCTKNDLTGEWCMDLFQAAGEDASTTSTTEEEDLDDICSKLVGLGCCFTSSLDYMVKLGINDTAIESMDATLAVCGLTHLPPPCTAPGQTTELVDITVNTNIPWDSWVSMTNKQKDAAILAASKDMAQKLSIDPSLVFPPKVTQGQTGNADFEFAMRSEDLSANNINNMNDLQETLENNPEGWTNLEAALPTDTVNGPVQTSDTKVEKKTVKNTAGFDNDANVASSFFAWVCSSLLAVSFIWTSM